MSPVWPMGAAFCAWLASWPARWLLFVAQRGAAAPAAVAAWPSGVWGGLLLAVVMVGGMFALRHPVARAVVGCVHCGGGRRDRAGAPRHRRLAAGTRAARRLRRRAGRRRGAAPRSRPAIVVDTGPEPTAIDGCLRRLGDRRRTASLPDPLPRGPCGRHHRRLRRPAGRSDRHVTVRPAAGGRTRGDAGGCGRAHPRFHPGSRAGVHDRRAPADRFGADVPSGRAPVPIRTTTRS